MPHQKKKEQSSKAKKQMPITGKLWNRLFKKMWPDTKEKKNM